MLTSYASIVKGLPQTNALKNKLAALSERIEALNATVSGRKIALNTEQLAEAKYIYDEQISLEAKYKSPQELLEIRRTLTPFIFNPNICIHSLSKKDFFKDMLSWAEEVYKDNKEKWASFYLQTLGSAYHHCRKHIIKSCYLHAKTNNRITPDIIKLTSDHLSASLDRVKTATIDKTIGRASRILLNVLDFLHFTDDANLFAAYNKKIAQLFPTQYLHLISTQGQRICMVDIKCILEASRIDAISTEPHPIPGLIPTDSFAVDQPSSSALWTHIITIAKSFSGATLFTENTRPTNLIREEMANNLLLPTL